MIDHVMRVKYGKSYDKDGATARSGKVDAKLMARFKNHDYFNRPIPRSAWRLDFGSSYADAFIEEFKHLPAGDLVATVTEFAAYSIVRSITDNVPSLGEISTIMASGGGTRMSILWNGWPPISRKGFGSRFLMNLVFRLHSKRR